MVNSRIPALANSTSPTYFDDTAYEYSPSSEAQGSTWGGTTARPKAKRTSPTTSNSTKTGFCGRYGHRYDCRCHLKHRIGTEGKQIKDAVASPACMACTRPSLKAKHTCSRGSAPVKSLPPKQSPGGECAACNRPSLKTKHTCARGREWHNGSLVSKKRQNSQSRTKELGSAKQGDPLADIGDDAGVEEGVVRAQRPKRKRRPESKTGFCGRYGHRADCRCHLKHRLEGGTPPKEKKPCLEINEMAISAGCHGHIPLLPVKWHAREIDEGFSRTGAVGHTWNVHLRHT